MFLILTDFVVVYGFQTVTILKTSLRDSLGYESRTTLHKPRMNADCPAHRPSAFIRVHLRFIMGIENHKDR
ncbi:MAG: hypothetical protein DRI57_17320 [Deltaproteobacteria bacterium]|nr:MAG: hypothetical protein DRI57_17320 [Deltaproteobacteria bacterium]